MQQQPPSLMPELWAKIFVHLEESAKSSHPFPQDTLDPQQHQREMPQLKLVCKQFRDIFASNSGLVQRLYLSVDFPDTSLPNLLDWMQQSKSSLQTFQSTCKSPVVEIVLTALLSSKSSITFVNIRHDISTWSIPIIASFTTLEKCCLNHSSDLHVHLAPLGVLKRLHSLTLQGQFMELHHLTVLTCLECIEASVCDVQGFAPTLQPLRLVVQQSLQSSYAASVSLHSFDKACAVYYTSEG